VCPITSSTPETRLLVGLVAAHGLGTIKVGVDAGVNLVQHVAVVGSSGRVGVSTTNSSAMSAVSTVSGVAASQAGRSVGAVLASSVTSCTCGVTSGSNSVAVNPWIGLVCHVRRVGTSGIVVCVMAQTGAGRVGVVASSQTGTSGVGVVATSQTSAGGVSVVATGQT